MFHSGESAPLRNSLVQRVSGRRRTERLPITLTETPDVSFVEKRFGCGHQHEIPGRSGRTLVGRVEAAHALDLVAEEIEPKRRPLARREQVDQRPANGELAMLGNRIDALIAKLGQLLDERLAIDPLACGDAPGELPNPEGREDPLDRTVGGHDQQLRPVERLLNRMQGRQALRHHSKRGRRAVIGQAVPRRQRQHFDLGREQRDRVGKRSHRRFVGGDYDSASRLASPARRARDVGCEPR
jgi:hypothetical protein